MANVPATVSVPKAAEALSISRSGAYAAVRRGDIPSIRIGKRVVVPGAWLLHTIVSASRETATGG